MSDGSLFVDIIPDFSTLRKRAKGEKVEVGSGSSGSKTSSGSGGKGGVPVSIGKGGVMGGLMKMLGKIGIAIFVVQKLMEVFQPVIDMIGAIVKTLGLLLIPVVRLLLVLLTPVLKWLANFVSDFLSDPFGAVIRGIRDIFTQLIPDLLSGIADSVVKALKTAFPLLFKDEDAARVREQKMVETSTMGGGIGVISPMIARFLDRLVPSSNLRSQSVINVEGITDEGTVEELKRKQNRMYGFGPSSI